jgi:D-tyrosyl-tRNA(Tyr) deacylase
VRVVLQRVRRASVTVEGRVVGSIGRGFLALVGVTATDGEAEVGWMAEKVSGIRLFGDAEGKMNLGLGDVDGAVLAVSQFTLYGDARKGRRPSFIDAAAPEIAEPIFDALVRALRERGVRVETGRFGAMMEVELVNDGPVTLVLER